MSLYENTAAFIIWLVWNHVRFYWYGFVFLLKQYVRPNVRLCGVTEPYAGTVAVVTGGSQGIGLEVVKSLMANGVNVVIGVRHPEELERLLGAWSKKNKPGGSYDCFHLDLASKKSVKRFAAEVEAMQTPINFLINNGGCMLLPHTCTPDGYETQFQVNYLSHYLLTHLLLPLLKAGASQTLPSRVVNVSSCAHRAARPDLHDLQFMDGYSSGLAYAQSKLCMVSSAKSWDDVISGRVDHLSHPVVFVAVHPGICSTALYQRAVWYNPLTKFLMDRFLLSPEQGSEYVIDAAFNPSLNSRGGAYLEHGRVVKPHEVISSFRFRNSLWRISRDLLNLT